MPYKVVVLVLCSGFIALNAMENGTFDAAEVKRFYDHLEKMKEDDEQKRKNSIKQSFGNLRNLAEIQLTRKDDYGFLDHLKRLTTASLQAAFTASQKEHMSRLFREFNAELDLQSTLFLYGIKSDEMRHFLLEEIIACGNGQNILKLFFVIVQYDDVNSAQLLFKKLLKTTQATLLNTKYSNEHGSQSIMQIAQEGNKEGMLKFMADKLEELSFEIV